MHNDFIGSLKEYSDYIVHELKQYSCYVKATAISNHSVIHTFAGKRYSISLVGDYAVRVAPLDEPGMNATHGVMTKAGASLMARRMCEYLTRYADKQKVVMATAKMLSHYDADELALAYTSDWYSIRDYSCSEYLLVASFLSGKEKAGSFKITIPTASISSLQSVFYYGASHYYKDFEGSEHIKAVMGIAPMCALDSSWSFEVLNAEIYDSSTMLEYRLGNKKFRVLISNPTKNMIIFTDMKTLESTTATIFTGHLGLDFEYCKIFKDFVTGKAEPDLIKKG